MAALSLPRVPFPDVSPLATLRAARSSLTAKKKQCERTERARGAAACSASLPLRAAPHRCEVTGAPEPEAAIAKFALGGRVLWCVPPAKGEERATLRWCESEDFEKVMVSTKMLAHHCCPCYMGAMAAP